MGYSLNPPKRQNCHYDEFHAQRESPYLKRFDPSKFQKQVQKFRYDGRNIFASGEEIDKSGAFWKTTYDENGGPTGSVAFYFDPDSVESYSTGWLPEDRAEAVFIWGAFKAVSVYTVLKLLGINDAGAGLTAGIGGATENLTVEYKFDYKTINASPWYGEVGHGFFGDVKYMDFQGLGNAERVTFEVSESYRVVYGDRVVSPETPTDVIHSMPHTSEFKNRDVRF